MSKPHGIDFGRWTQWARPDSPPKPVDFVIAGITSGNYVLQTYEANKIHLQAEPRLMVYHFFEAVSAQVQADLFSQKAEEVGAKALWIDWEDTTYHTLNAADVATLIKMYDILKLRFPIVGVYANHDDFWFIQQHAPQFAKDVEWWLGYPTENPDITQFHSVYVDKLNRPFSSVRFLQYSWKGNAPAYGAVNEKDDMDLDVFQGTLAELDEWLGISSPEPPTEPEPPTGGVDLGWLIKLLGGATKQDVALLAGKHEADLQDLQEQIAELGYALEVHSHAGTQEPGYIEAMVHNDIPNVYLSYYTEMNEGGSTGVKRPIFKFYPENGAPVNQRVFVPVDKAVYVKDRTQGDGSGNYAWKVDMSRLPLAPGSAPVPNVQLYVMEKFL